MAAMKPVADFSDEPKYTIKVVCAQTGIRAVTLRAWERRHAVLSPHRSENRYRLYSERDLAILRWVKNRVDGGMPISSAVNELHTMLRNGLFLDVVPAGPLAAPIVQTLPPEQVARRLYQALIAHDEGKAGEVFQEIQAGFSLTAICQDIITPVMVEIGEAWFRGSIRITTEHFASAFVRGKLLGMFQAYPIQRSAPFILIGCAPNEQHELGGLMMAALLRSSGYRVEYLGPDIPLGDVVDYASYEHPKMIILTASLEAAALDLEGMQGRLSKLRAAPVFGFGGAAFVAKPELQKSVRGVYLGNTLEAGVSTVRTLFPIR
jgi:methanogenic corrinoid protein MtbC1